MTLGRLVVYSRGWGNLAWFFISFQGRHRHAVMAQLCVWMLAAGPVEVQWRRS